jgi:glycosyltransferase involved in cell wall biosynthesis
MAGSPRRRRILLVTNLFGWAGAEKQLEHLAAGLARAGHSVVLLALGGRYVDLGPLEAEGVEVIALGAHGRLGKLRALGAVRRHARRAELVHCTGWDATLWGRLAAFLARRPAVITEHTPGRDSQVAGTEGRAGARTIAAHNRILDRVTYATIAVGAWQRDLLIGEGVRPQAIVHIPNGVPVSELRARAAQGPSRASVGVPEDALVAIQVSRFAPQKGQRVALAALAGLRQRLGQDVRLLFVGGGGDEEEVRREAEESGAGWATFLGFREDVAGLLELADLSVLPSEAEGLPMSLLETVAVGTPIVATDVGDVRWFLEVTEAGICVPAGDEEAFEEACGRILGDPALRARLAAAAGAAAGEFDAARMVRRYEEVFEAAIAAAPLPVRLSE